jgi:ATP-dependent DNA helicase PIF1
MCVGAKIVLTNNLWTQKGLVNGANGTIRDIIFLISSRNNLPQTIFIEFEHYTGPNFFLDFHPKKKWTPINSYNSYAKNLGCSRTQFPLRLAYALTIHKSQGQTISKAVIDIGRVEKSLGMSFVAFSRVKNYKDYLVEPFSLERFLKIKESSTLQARNVEENRINNIVDETLTRFNYLLNFRNE